MVFAGVMASVKLYRHSLFLRYLQMRHFHHSSRLGKKQYEYDLDNLVKWKQETKMLFGPQRKPTKSGKLKKRKKEVPNQVLENVEVLSSISNNYIADSSGNIDKNFNSCELYNDHLPISNSKSNAVPHNGKISLRKDSMKGRSVQQSKTEKTERNVSSPCPESENNQELPFIEGSEKCTFPDSQEAEISRGQVLNQVYKVVIEIPKIEPVPSSKDKVTSKSKRTLMPAGTHPPIEAPQSFEVISSFPLAPQGKLGDSETQQLHSFKMDVEQMALRVLPSVKTILNKTMSDLNRFFLNRWREGMINELGEEGFQKYKNDTMRQGTNLHANVMEFLSGKQESELQIMPENEGHWASLHTALQSVSDIRALEMDVLHPSLLYRGVFDCVARYKDLLCIIDWKVSKKPRPLLKNTYDDPLQVAAYVGAMNASDHYVKQHGEINHGLIVVAYPDGSPAHMHLMNRSQVEQYWLEWTTRLHSYFILTYTEKFVQKHPVSTAGKT